MSREFLSFFLRRWWLLAVGPLIAGLVAFGIAKQMTPVYRATATMIVVNQTQTGSTIQLNDILTNERLTNTYAQLVKRRSILTTVGARVGISADDLGAKITVSAVTDTQLLRIDAEDANPELAATIANGMAEAFIRENATELGRPGTITIAEAASPPRSPFKPNVMLYAMLAAFGGALLAMAAARGLDFLDDAVKTPEEASDALGVPALGVISRFSHSSADPFALNAATAEDYKELRTNIHFMRLERELKTLTILSQNPREGKSTTALNLAIVLAQAGDNVILVDTDLRRPTLHERIGKPNTGGLTGLLLNNNVNVLGSLIETKVPHLRVLPAGLPPPNPSELLMSTRMAKLIESLKELSEFVIFDSSPTSLVTDATVLAARTDGAIFVVQYGRTRPAILHDVGNRLRQKRLNLIGVVVNKSKRSRRNYKQYGYNPELTLGDKPETQKRGRLSRLKGKA